MPVNHPRPAIDHEADPDCQHQREKSPQAVKDFLLYARTRWKLAPRYVLLAGDASYDQKNYLGAGDFDLVPTKLIDTEFMETASDDWFADFDNDGLAEMATGRLPVRTAAEAAAMVADVPLMLRQAGVPGRNITLEKWGS